MSSTSNAQDLLVNVFRPTYRWDPTTGFTPSLVVSNVTEVITDSIITGKLAVSDSNANTYIGCNAGPPPANLTTRENTAIGYSAMSGASNSSNNVAIGTSNFDGLTNSTSNVGIGAETYITGSGQKNILLGANLTLGDGSGNILIGTDLSVGSVSNRFQLGRILYGNLAAGYVGINTSNPEAPLDISGEVIFRNKVGLQKLNPVYTLDVAGTAYADKWLANGFGFPSFVNYAFCNAPDTGMYLDGPGADLGFAKSGTRVMTLNSTKSIIYGDLDVCGTVTSSGGSASFLAAAGTASEPAYSFSGASNLGFYRTTDASGTAIGIAIGGSNRLVVGSNKMTMLGNLDVCGTFSAVSGGGGGTIASNGIATAPSFTFSNDASSGVYLQSVSNLGFATAGVNRMSILNTGDVSAERLVVSTYLRNTTGGTRTLDISGGNISNSGTTTSTNALISGYLRNALTPSTLDISGGNISNSGSTRSGSFVGGASASNQIGGVTLSNNAVTTPTNATNSIGGLTLTNGIINGIFSNASTTNNFIGGVQMWDGAVIAPNGYVLANGGLEEQPSFTFSNAEGTGLYQAQDASYGTGALAIAVNQSPRVVVMSNKTFIYGDLDVCGTFNAASGGGGGGGGGGTVASNGSAAAPSFTFSNDSTTGMYLSETGVLGLSTDGVQRVTINAEGVSSSVFTGTNPGGYNVIGGVLLSNYGVNAGGSNSIGGVMLWEGVLSNAADTINSIGGVTLSNGTVIGTFSNDVTQSNSIGGVTLYDGTISNAQNTNNSIGGITLNDTYIEALSAAIGGVALQQNAVLASSDYGHSLLGISYFSPGGIGIGTLPNTFQLELSEDSAAKPFTNTWSSPSDRRVKQNIQRADIRLCYDTIKRLPLQRFTWDASFAPTAVDRNSVGWIAQDVSDVFPNAVRRISNAQFPDFHTLNVDQLYKTMYGALEKVIADKESLEAKFTQVLARLTALESATGLSVMDVSETVMDVSGVVMDASETVLDVSSVVMDASETVLDVSSVVMDVSGVVMDVSSVVMDASETVMDVSGASQQSSESTQTTPPTPPPPSESPESSPEPPQPPSSEYAPAPATTEA
jgi:hypothetical protein